MYALPCSGTSTSGNAIGAAARMRSLGAGIFALDRWVPHVAGMFGELHHFAIIQLYFQSTYPRSQLASRSPRYCHLIVSFPALWLTIPEFHPAELVVQFFHDIPIDICILEDPHPEF